jgi:hypothetical protein
MPPPPVASHDELRTLVQNPCHWHCFAHPVDSFPIIETHITRITSAQRRFYCEEELRLSQQSAPELYLVLTLATGELRPPNWRNRKTAIPY